ncbi:hypothetical protein [Aneurinibacillus tyrosinisolvens]|uniref:hypothetical protein n=1 Tax=Aneurinibacillus tyrosinisolvens TaxID=1443435 RepID=UPI00063F761B|nr:hypothetical protein [Aneurinibacillus tyrosinisolvens]
MILGKALDLKADVGLLNTLALKLCIWLVGLIIFITIVELFVPKWLRGITHAATLLFGIYVFSVWVS